VRNQREPSADSAGCADPQMTWCHPDGAKRLQGSRPQSAIEDSSESYLESSPESSFQSSPESTLESKLGSSLHSFFHRSFQSSLHRLAHRSSQSASLLSSLASKLSRKLASKLFRKLNSKLISKLVSWLLRKLTQKLARGRPLPLVFTSSPRSQPTDNEGVKAIPALLGQGYLVYCFPASLASEKPEPRNVTSHAVHSYIVHPSWLSGRDCPRPASHCSSERSGFWSLNSGF
jgi:hypothetical protein